MENTYSWQNVARRTEKCYDYCMKKSILDTQNTIKTQLSCGPVAGVYALLDMLFEFVLLFALEWLVPDSDIDVCPNFDMDYYQKDPSSHGNHKFSIKDELSLKTDFEIGSSKDIKKIRTSFFSGKRPGKRPAPFGFNRSNRYLTIP